MVLTIASDLSHKLVGRNHTLQNDTSVRMHETRRTKAFRTVNHRTLYPESTLCWSMSAFHKHRAWKLRKDKVDIPPLRGMYGWFLDGRILEEGDYKDNCIGSACRKESVKS